LRIHPACLAAVAALAARPAAAEPPAIEVRAGRARADLDGGCVELDGGASLSTGRLRLDADRLRVIRRPDGRVDVEGPARLSPCPCQAAPLTLDLDGATVFPDGDVTLRGATARVGGVPVLYTPWLRLRPESAVGLLPPRVAYRASDGLLAGAGVHLPASSDAWIDLEPALYARGGHELLASARVGPATARLRWDHRGSDLVAVTSRGAAGAGEQGAASGPARASTRVAWDADLARGPRARAATIDLEPAARAYDRFSAAAVFPAGGTLAAGARGALGRGTGRGFAGPRIGWATSGAPTPSTAVALSLDGSSLAASGDEVWHVGRADALGAGSVRRGAVVVAGVVRAAASGYLMPDAARDDAFALAELQVSAPLARRLRGAAGLAGAPGARDGRPADGRGAGQGVLHLVEPSIRVAAAAGHVSAGVPGPLGRALPSGSGGLVLPSAALSSRLGFPSGSSARAELSSGVVLTREALRPLGRASAAADAPLLRGGLEAAAAGGERRHAGGASGATAPGRGAGLLVLAAAWLGPPDGLSLGASVEGLEGLSPVEARALAGPWFASGGWLAGEGWTASGGVSARLTASFTARAWAAADLTSRERLGERLTLSYGHPCGCLAAALHAGHRQGREGTDVWLNLGLTP
jgi:hypothetical protein